MRAVRKRGEIVRRFILENIGKHPKDIVTLTGNKFKISHQGAHKHLAKLVHEKVIIADGRTKNRRYKLVSLVKQQNSYKITPDLAEDVVWTNDIRSVLSPLPDNVLNILHFGFTEIFNNAIDHSGASEIIVTIEKTAAGTTFLIEDDGIGIFKKIQNETGLLDERHSVLELSKGKLTTDPENHTGEGIFFTTRMFDSFDILSGGVYFPHKHNDERDVILQTIRVGTGTSVWMAIHNHTSRTMKKIFNQFTSGDDIGFTKTYIPVRLAQYGDNNLISRSQAKRVLVRIEKFKTVVFNFEGVEFIGQAFADEIFRVFAKKHPEIEILTSKTHPDVKRMIKHVTTQK